MKTTLIKIPSPKDRDDFFRALRNVKARNKNYEIAQKFLEYRNDSELGRAYELALMLKINLIGCGPMTACNAAVEILQCVQKFDATALLAKGRIAMINEKCKHAEEAEEAGYKDAFFDGLHTFPSGLSCGCAVCRAAYEKGAERGVTELLEMAG